MPKAQPLTLAELAALLPRLEATVATLVGQGRRGRAAAAPSDGQRKAGRGARSRSRAGAAQLQDKLLGVLKGGKGLQLGEIVKKVGADSGAVQYHLRALRTKNLARVVGDRKQARWFAK
jgi:hypothetical protein